MRYATVFATLLLTCVAASAASFDAPKRKSGLWEIKVENAAGMGGRRCNSVSTRRPTI